MAALRLESVCYAVDPGISCHQVKIILNNNNKTQISILLYLK